MDEHATMLNYEIPRGAISSLSKAFAYLEGQKAPLGILDYALSQSTLEQVTCITNSSNISCCTYSFVLLLYGTVLNVIVWYELVCTTML